MSNTLLGKEVAVFDETNSNDNDNNHHNSNPSNPIEASWAGGTDGRVVIDRALPQIASLLSKPHGAAYMITVDDNKPEDIASIMQTEYGIYVRPFFRRRARNEFLTVLKMTYEEDTC